jgi:putative tryptophan/tyrosine transport system substrate-binding protein
MKRREFISLVCGVVAVWPTATRAQQPQRRIGVLQSLPANDPEGQTEVDALRKGLAALGWIEGRNINIEYRWPGGDIGHARTSAKEIVALKPEVIVSRSTPATAALLNETRTIPIIFVQVTDPLSSGFVQSFSHPGGNVTGFTNVEASMSGKWIELLKQIAPRVTRVAFMFNPATAPYFGTFRRPAEIGAATLGLELSEIRVRSEAEIESAMRSMASRPGGSIVAIPDTFLVEHRSVIISLAASLGLPAVFGNRLFTASGGLMNYAVDTLDIFRSAANYVDRILKGTKVSDLPVQAPTKYQLIINLKTAKALGLTVPPMLLALADEVIE